MIKKTIIVSLVALLGFSMHLKLPAQQLDVIDIEAVFKEVIPLDLSVISSGIEYIPLETKDECVLGDIHNLLIHGDHIVLISEKEVFLFNTQGKFLRKLGGIGMGPGEYQWARDLQFHPSGESVFVVDITGMKIIEYALDGSLQNTIQLPQKQYPEDVVFFDNHFYVLSGRVALGMDFIYIMDRQGKFVKDLTVTCEAYESALHGGFQESGGVMIGKDYFDLATAWNDTIFRIQSIGKKKALFVIKYGKYKYPLEGSRGSLSRQPPKEGYAYQHWRAISEDYVFIHYQDGRSLKLAVYDRNRTSIIHSSDVMTKNGGIKNDLDGGPKISWIPSFQKNNGKDLIQTHSALSLIETVNGNIDNSQSFKITKATEDLRELTSQLSEEDNPVIQIIHLK